MIGLQLWYAVQIVRSEKKDFVETLNRCTKLYAYYNVFDKSVQIDKNCKWLGITHELYRHWQTCGDEMFFFSFWDILGKYLEPRIGLNLKKNEDVLTRSYYGFWYEYHPEYFGPEKPDLLTLHFGNYFVPDSPFRHTSELVDGLLQIIDTVLNENSDMTRVQCASWLNCVEPFLKLFPESWGKSSKDCPENKTLDFGWWGQFVDRTGQLHKMNVAKFKQTGKFVYPNRWCCCDISDLRQHLVRTSPS